MTFGQASGPPATGKQVQTLLTLLNAAGHVDFRDARGPMGFTQRQAAGKFTRDEADGFIEQLEQAAEAVAHDTDPVTDSRPPTTIAPGAKSRTASRGEPRSPTRRSSASSAGALAGFSTEELAAELQRRGWVVLEP